MLQRLFGGEPTPFRAKLIGLYSLLILFNLLAWGWALVAFHDYPILLGTALLAYTFGLRHAVDADHIAAIDNVTRKMMQEGKRPLTVGLFFSLGHSTIVVALSVAIAATTAALQNQFESFKAVGGVIGTSVSAFFLFAIAAANIVVLVSVLQTFRRVKAGHPIDEEDIDLLLSRRGFLGRIFRRLFRLIGRSWHMYPLGLLFGLGFDTATEVGLLGISASQASMGLPIWSILVFPVLFTAGMTLVDTIDSTLMLAAYDWAFRKPIRKLYYNITITSLSVVIAVLIGCIETLALLADKLGLDGAFWNAIGAVSENFGFVGFGLIGIFMATWAISLAIYRIRRYDEIEVRT